MTDVVKARALQELKDIKHKTGLMAFCHGVLLESRGRWNDWSAIISSIAAGLASVLITMDSSKFPLFHVEKGILEFAASFCSGVVFLIVVMRRHLEWGVASGKHAAAMERYVQFLRDLNFFLEVEGPSASVEDVARHARQLIQTYAKIGESAPKIPTEKFLYLKQQYLQTKHVSKKLDSAPFASLESLRQPDAG